MLIIFTIHFVDIREDSQGYFKHKRYAVNHQSLHENQSFSQTSIIKHKARKNSYQGIQYA